jgi:glycosyltransferase involved in cell wall biosynthesis
MNKKVNLSIVIPCYNEEKNLENLIKSIELILKRNKFIQFVLVNNGSTDNTKKIIQSMNNQNILIVNLKNNLGYGHGIMSGVKRSTGKVIAWCHSDLQVKLKDVISAYLKNKKNLENNYVLVKGKRTNRSIFDIFFTFFMSVIVNTIFDVNLNDINAQPKVFSQKVKKDIFKNYPKDFSLDLFLLIKARKKKLTIVEHPVILYDRKAGKAKGGGSLIGKFKLIARTFKFIYKLKFNY